MKTLYVQTREEWRNWLAENHDRESEIWLMYHKKATGKPSIGYGESVEEALCYGWIDSLINSIDDERYTRKFTPRKEGSNWSASNIKRIKKLVEQGLMTEAGMRRVEDAKRSGSWENPVQPPELSFEMLPEFAEVLQTNDKARQTWESLSNTNRKQYLGWMETAKRPDTRERRIKESIELLEQGKKLGLR